MDDPIVAEVLAQPIPKDSSLMTGGPLHVQNIERFYYVEMGALLAGADPVEAMRLAMKHDHWCHRRKPTNSEAREPLHPSKMEARDE